MKNPRNVFVSYRRSADGPAAEEIHSRLARALGENRVFFDRDQQSLRPGESWPYELVSHVAASETFLPVIGPGWADEFVLRNRRADQSWLPELESTDWVRREIAFALQFGKRVIPLFVNGGKMPTPEVLSDDLRELRSFQGFVIGHDSAADIDELCRLIDAPHASRLATPLPAMTREPATPAGLRDDADSPAGKRWDPRHETDSPHVMDYKFCILDPEVRHRIRVGLLAAQSTGELWQGMTLSELQRLGEPRKFSDGSKKQGMFIQASCVVTDGLADGDVTSVLMAIRDEHQFHGRDQIIPRNVSGESCLTATCLTAFGKHQGSGHLPTALLNHFTEPNPWAVFSRKLLVPDSVIDCKFLGVGFNLANPDKEYVHFVWQVRTRSCPEIMLVPAREKINYDEPVWQTKAQLAEYDFESAPIDRAMTEKVFRLALPEPKNPVRAAWMTGFVRCPSFDSTAGNGDQPVRWVRDTVPLDLLRMFQQKVRRRQILLKSSGYLDLLDALEGHLKDFAKQSSLRVEPFAFAGAAAPFDRGLILTVTDEEGRPVGTHLLLAAEWTNSPLTDDLVTRVRERADIPPDGLDNWSAVMVLQGVRTANAFEIQGAQSLHDRGRVPIHVIRVATGESAIPVKRVAHAIIPVRNPASGRPDSLLMTLSPGDERPRLPGGKIENDESPVQALARELREELALEDDEVIVSPELLPDGILMTEPSPSTHLLTHYKIYPFVVRVVGNGVETLRRQLSNPSPGDACRVWPVTFDHWTESGSGFNAAYARTVVPMLTPELLAASALDAPDELGT